MNQIDMSVLNDTEKIIYALRALYIKNGFECYKMSKFEEYDFYARNKDFLASERIITFTDTNGKLMALKPDVTLSIIKNIEDEPANLTKLCYNESVYRPSKGEGSFKEIMQTGLECLGAVDGTCVSEVISLAIQSLKLLSKSAVLQVSHLGLVSRLVDEATDDRAIRKEIMRCLSEKNIHELEQVAGKAEVDAQKISLVKLLISNYGEPSKVFEKLEKDFEGAGFDSEIEELKTIIVKIDKELAACISIDFSLIGDVRYYNGVIFKGYIREAEKDVLSGGQYDDLMKKMGKKSKAIGFAVFLDVLDRLDLEEAF